jgi:hypothetical protein
MMQGSWRLSLCFKSRYFYFLHLVLATSSFFKQISFWSATSVSKTRLCSAASA